MENYTPLMLPEDEDVLSRERWIETVARSFLPSMPDQYPESFAYGVAMLMADEGAYLNYLSGDYGNKLYDPEV